MLTAICIAWGVLNFTLALAAIKKVRQHPHHLDFMYSLGFISGAFVWEDMLVFGLLHTLSVILGFLVHDLRYTILLFLLFWAVRSLGEAVYFFLQQFHEPKHHPHYITDFFGPLRRFFPGISDQKCFIIMQVFMQSVLVLSLFATVVLVMQWGVVGALPPTISVR